MKSEFKLKFSEHMCRNPVFEVEKLFEDRFKDMADGNPAILTKKAHRNIHKIIKRVGEEHIVDTVNYVFDNWDVFKKCEPLKYNCSALPTSGLLFSSYFEMFYAFMLKGELPELIEEEKDESRD